MGASVLIKGTVTDQSPGMTCKGIPAAGTPAISDNSMTAWMEYLYMQQSKPTDATGVEVHLTAVDPNGNFQDIGTTTSNTLGNFAFEWTPPVPGLYSVTAAFEGSEAYFASEAGTSFIVSESSSYSPALTTTSQSVLPAIDQAPQPATSANVTTTYVAIGAAVVIVIAAAAALVLTKRK